MNFFVFMLLEFKRFFCRKKLFIFLLILLLSLYGAYQGIKEYKDTLSESREFQKLQESMFSTLLNYNDYVDLGVNVFFVQSATSIFFTNPAVLSELSAKVSTIETFDIYNNCHGKGVLKQNHLFHLRFSVIVLVLGSLAALFMGLEPMRSRDYLKSISSICSTKTVYLSVISSRFILLTINFLIIFGLMLCMVIIANIELSKNDLYGLAFYIISTLLMLLFFLISGTIIGSIRSNGVVFITLIIVWFSFVFLIPSIFNSIIDEKSDDISSTYKLINDKLKILSDFEKRTDGKYGKFNIDNIEVERKIVEEYWNNDLKKIEALEEQLKNETKKVIKSNNNLSLFVPTTFYNLTSYEVSSRGYLNYLDFYGYLQKTMRNFVRFWIDRVFYNDPKEIVSFIKGDENLYYAKSQLPENFGTGVVINLGYIIILLFFSYFRFKKALFPKQKDANAFDNINLNFVSGKHMAYKVYKKNFITQLLNVFFGKIKNFSGKITIDEKNIVTTEKKDFLYLPKSDQIPGDIKTKALLTLFKGLLKISKENFQKIISGLDPSLLKKYFNKLENHEKALLLLKVAQMKEKSTIVIDNITLGIPDDFQKEIREAVRELKNNGSLIINIFSDQNLWMEPDSFSAINFYGSKYDELTAGKL